MQLPVITKLCVQFRLMARFTQYNLSMSCDISVSFLQKKNDSKRQAYNRHIVESGIKHPQPVYGGKRVCTDILLRHKLSLSFVGKTTVFDIFLILLSNISTAFVNDIWNGRRGEISHAHNLIFSILQDATQLLKIYLERI